MEQNKLQELLEKYFNQSENKRQIVFWYDENGVNQDKLDTLNFANIKIHKLTGSNNLETKKLLEHDDLDSNYLIYAPFVKPASEDNWFLDTQLYSKEFVYDEVSNLCSEFEVYDNDIKKLFKSHIKFFNSKDRVNKLKKILKNNSPEAFYLGMFAVLVKENIPDINRIVQRYIIASILYDEDINSEFEKYDLEEKFWDLLNSHFGYEGEHNATLLFANIIFTKLSQQFSSSKFPTCYNKYLNSNKTAEVEYDVFLDGWHRDNELVQSYKQLIAIDGILEDKFNLSKHISDWSDIIANDPEFTTLELFDVALIKYLVDSFDSLKFEDKKLLEKRKNTLFFEKYENTYRALYHAIDLKVLVSSTLIPDQTADNFIKNYAKEYFKIDKAYRKFYYYCQKSASRLLDSVKDFVEKAYVNNYLCNINSKFSNQLSTLAPTWSIIGIPAQKDFYFSELKGSKTKTVVIISDSLRYEVAEDLMQSIRSNYSIKADTTLEYMLGSIPSYTKLGMTALLPNCKNITINSKGEYLIDNISTEGSQNREKILQSSNPKSKVLQITDLDDLSREELKDIFKEIDVAYIYQDKIDYTGEKSDKDLFNAAEEAIKELSNKIKFIFNNSLASNIIVTSDHGFLYQYSELEERQKITIGSIDALKSNKRFILSETPISEHGVMNFDMNYILNNSNLKVSIPFNVNRFKTQGSGINYVHGGASLQEIVVPLLKIKQNRGQKAEKVEVILESSSRKITNNKHKLEFLQKDSISEFIKPRIIKASMWDIENNEQISNEIIIDANIESENMQDRIFKKTLSLKNFKQDKNKTYYLILEDVNEVGEPCAKIPFTINLLFEADF